MISAVTVPDAVRLVTPVMVPALVIPPAWLLIPPVMEAPAAETVKPLAAVIVPVPVVKILAEVEMLPDAVKAPLSVMVKLGLPPDWIERAVWLAVALVSLMMKALPLPALVKVNDVSVAKPLPKVKSMLRPVVVVMVLPLS